MRSSFVLAKGVRVASLGFAWIIVASCSANSTDNSKFNQGAGGTGAGGQIATGGAAGTGMGGGQIQTDSGQGGGLTEAGACAGDVFPGKLVPLDIYILLDATASMNGANDTPKVWPDVTNALLSIIADPKTEGIGMGLTFLPVKPPDGFKVPGSCKVEADCPGSTGPCKAISLGLPKTCTNACTIPTVEQDCGLYGECMPMPPPPLQTQYRICNGAIVPNVSCDPLDYGQPVVPIETLPGNKDALSKAISDKDPDGDATPTEPSLRGALAYAKQWAVDHPTHLVHVLFGTDGLPNDCTFNSIDGAAAAAKESFEGDPSVPTFVLGIGDLDDLGPIAQGGGTEKPYIADGATVAKTMVDVFNEIRAKGACKFQIPTPNPGMTLDYGLVNVSYIPLAQTEPVTVKYVASESECDPKEGGWFYDTDPSQGKPSKILLCPATCAEVKLSDKGVSVRLGCKTIVK